MMGDVPAIEFRHAIVDAQAPLNPHIKAVGDLNGDGVPEIVVASSNGGPLVWYEYPTWSRHVIAPSGKWSCDAVLVDMDGDGDLDVLTSEWYTHNRLEWFENPLPSGNPARDPWQRHVIGSPRAHDIEAADIDADGALEIVTRIQGKEGNQIVIWEQTGRGLWERRVLDCPAGEGLTVGPLTGSGRLDIVIGGRWYEAPPDALHDPWPEHVFAEWPPDAVVRVADVNQDGRLEVVLTRSEGAHRLSWFAVPADPCSSNWAEHVIDDSIDYAHSLVIRDMNGDGRPDVVTAEMHQSARKRVLVYFNEGQALKWRRQVLAVTGSHNLCVADFAGTGRPAVVGANWSGSYQPVEVWEQQPRSGG